MIRPEKRCIARSMKIQFVRTGGFAGIRLARAFDTESMPPEQAGKLQALVDAARFFDMPEPAESPSRVPDSLEYRLTVSSSERERTIVVNDAALPVSLRPLMEYLTSLARRGGPH